MLVEEETVRATSKPGRHCEGLFRGITEDRDLILLAKDAVVLDFKLLTNSTISVTENILRIIRGVEKTTLKITPEELLYRHKGDD